MTTVGAGPELDTLNAELLDAIKSATEFALGFAPLSQQTADASAAITPAAAIAYAKAAQAAALAVQDAADYQRNVLSLCAAAQGKALAVLLKTPEEPDNAAVVAFSLALVGSLVAPMAAGLAATAASETLKNFPKA